MYDGYYGWHDDGEQTEFGVTRCENKHSTKEMIGSQANPTMKRQSSGASDDAGWQTGRLQNTKTPNKI